MTEPQAITFTRLRVLLANEEATRQELLPVIIAALERDSNESPELSSVQSDNFLRTIREYMIAIEELANILKKEPLAAYLLKHG